MNHNKKAILIGATSGIGHSLAIILANNGYTVGITGRRRAMLEKLALDNLKGDFIISDFDASIVNNLCSHLEELTYQLGGLDLVIISSGTGEINEELDFEKEKNTIDLNVTGFTAIADWSINYFIKQGHGHLVAITSIAGIRGSRSAPAYNATKAYQINYLEGLHQAVFKNKLPITVTDVRPGFVDTAMAKGEDLFWVAPVIKASNQIFNAIIKKKRVVYVTRRWAIIAFLLRFIPSFIYRKM